MKKTEPKYIYRFACGVILTALAVGMFLFVWFRFVSAFRSTSSLMGKGNLGMSAGIYLILYVAFGSMVRAFGIGVERKAATVAAQIVTLFLTDFTDVFISLAVINDFRFFWRILWRYMALWVVQSLFLSTLIMRMIDRYRRLFPPLRLLEIYGDRVGDMGKKIREVPYKYRITERLRYDDPAVDDAFDRVDALLLGDLPAEARNDLLKTCFARDKRVYFVPKISDIIAGAADSLKLFDTPLYLCRNSGMRVAQWWTKRAFDIFASAAALIVLSPVFALTALAIKLDDGGPVFFRQERSTIGGRRFMILKFRSMIVDAEKDGRTHPAGENDDRITRVGRFIRRTRIDELPQLINILKGEMSVVGPRPERVEHTEIYSELIPEFPLRNKAKGGLTGYAQVYGKYNTSALDKLKLDLIYITHFSLVLDMQIILETLKILLRKESTEGFSAENAAELHDYSAAIEHWGR